MSWQQYAQIINEYSRYSSDRARSVYEAISDRGQATAIFGGVRSMAAIGAFNSMRSDDGFFRMLHVDLSDREALLIGKIVAQWGALEHEVFLQTLLTFEADEGHVPSLPKAMNNMQFTEVLNEWKARVVDLAVGERGTVLRQQFEEIFGLKDYRNALVHGMWEWSSAELHKITTVRVRKKQVVRTGFSADDLESLLLRVGIINFKIRYPGGLEDLVEARSKVDFLVSRRFLASVTGSPVANDWVPFDEKRDESGE